MKSVISFVVWGVSAEKVSVFKKSFSSLKCEVNYVGKPKRKVVKRRCPIGTYVCSIDVKSQKTFLKINNFLNKYAEFLQLCAIYISITTESPTENYIIPAEFVCNISKLKIPIEISWIQLPS